jgi:putative polyhydroxyalkanoate system protein
MHIQTGVVMKVVRKHGVTRQRARGIVEGFLPELESRYGSMVSNLSYTWEGDVLRFSFRASGANLKGQILVNEKEVELEVGIPFLARPFEKTIRARVEEVMCEALLSAEN